MIISDLTYMETASDEVFGAGVYFDKYINSNINTKLNFNANSDIKSRFDKKARIDVDSYVRGNSSTFAFDNEAAGFATNTQGELNQLAVAGSYYSTGVSSQNGLFVAAANNY